MGIAFTGDQTFLLANYFFKIHGALLMNAILYWKHTIVNLNKVYQFRSNLRKWERTQTDGQVEGFTNSHEHFSALSECIENTFFKWESACLFTNLLSPYQMIEVSWKYKLKTVSCVNHDFHSCSNCFVDALIEILFARVKN